MFCMLSKKIALISLVALLFLAGCSQQPMEKFAFTWVDSGITYKSNQAGAKELLGSFSVKPKILIATEVHAGQNPENAEIFNWSTIPLYVIISGNDRNAIQLIKFIKDRELQQCITNSGDFNTQITLNSSDCNSLLQKWASIPTISLLLPNSSLPASFIEVRKNSLVLHSRSTQEESALSTALAEKLFPNARSILRKASKKLKELK